MSQFKYLDNAFWEDGCDDQTKLKCIRQIQTETGRKNEQQLLFKINPNNGQECEHYKDVIAQVGIDKINDNTTKRRERKAREEKENRAKHEQIKQAKELEHLFALKLKAFEVEAIKNSEDKKLRTRLRRAQNEVEMNAIATLIIGKEMGILNVNSD